MRIKKNLSQKSLADLLFVSQQTVAKWETDRSTPNPETVLKIANLFNVTTDELLGKENATPKKRFMIPVLGRVVAGIPLEAVEDILDWEEITPDMASQGEYFALRIQGDSMSPIINDGDIVVIKKQADVDSGNVAIVYVNGNDATCKKIIKHETGVSLVPNNPIYEPIFYSNAQVLELPVTILGRVVELRRKF